MTSPALIENLKQLFAECDTNNKGSLGREEFSELCTKIGLTREAADESFDRLDIDRNDRITFDEFAAGFIQYKQTSISTSTSSPQPQSPAVTSTSTVTSNSTSASTSASTSRLSSPTGALSPSSPQPSNKQQVRSSPGMDRNQRLSPGPVNSRARKNASPLGIMSLGSTGSSGNLVGGGGRNSGGGSLGADVSVGSSDFNSSADGNSTYGFNGGGKEANHSDMIVYSSDQIADYDQASGSGQFGSLMSSSGGSLNQVRNMQDLLECVQKLQSENQILTQIFFKDKREREEYISQLGEEFDLQVKEVEERANRRAREELENEKKRLREMMQTERETLQHHYQTIEKMSKLIKSPNGKLEDGEGIDKVKSKLEDTFMENRQLKRSLLDTKSDVAMIWKEMEKLKRQYEDKLSSAYERNNETRSECDHIKQQLTLMKDSNRKLQDASDVITHYITDKVEPVIKGAEEGGDPNYLCVGSEGSSMGNRFGGGGQSVSQSNSRKGSILSEYLNGADPSNLSMDGYNAYVNSVDLEPMVEEERMSAVTTTTNTSSSLGGGVPPHPPKPKPRGGATTGSSSGPRSVDSSRPTSIKSSSALRNVVTSNSITSDNRSRSPAPDSSLASSSSQPNQRSSQSSSSSNSKQNSSSQSELSKSSSLRNIGRHFFIGTRAKSDAQVNDKDIKTEGVVGGVKSISLDNINEEPLVEPADGPSKATFNIILVGDSFVGKSSFVARFIEGSFVKGLISNCSIDFKTKSYKVDGINYTVNLWDTAGQERFRSITASYFRKADGIILMYDVTDKRSYLNVRNWMSTISDTASENVAVLLIGNKIDLRLKDNMNKCVPTEEGFRLAKEYEIVFLETSVKTGTNLVPSMGKLIRLIAKNNAPAEEDLDRIRLNDKSRSFNCMPKNC